ncbi:MAG TPA: glycine-rich protein [Candidatus Cybelea sp.]
MRILSFGASRLAVAWSQHPRFRCGLGICVAAAMLAGCGGSQSGNALMMPAQRDAHGAKTFNYTGGEQRFKVPSGITQLTVMASGASGASQNVGYCLYSGGNGGVLKATIPVTSGERLSIFVGGEGSGASSDCSPGTAGGFNGGGNGGKGCCEADGTGGGGASDVREGGDALANRILVAGGGGGGGVGVPIYYNSEGTGGPGGGRVGGPGTGGYGVRGHTCYIVGYGGKGGTQTAGGRGGRRGHDGCGGPHGYRGHFGAGGNGGGYASTSGLSGGGGGAGGGYYGGGGGGAGGFATSGIGGGGGGGGGSSYVEKQATHVEDKQGAAPPGNGKFIITW